MEHDWDDCKQEGEAVYIDGNGPRPSLSQTELSTSGLIKPPMTVFSLHGRQLKRVWAIGLVDGRHLLQSAIAVNIWRYQP